MKSDTVYTLSASNRQDKKWMVKLPGSDTHVHFGATGYSDYTLHKDKDRKKRYIQRHRSNENWNKSGIHTAGFWSRWILWNCPSLQASIRDTEHRFNIRIVKKRT